MTESESGVLPLHYEAFQGGAALRQYKLVPGRLTSPFPARVVWIRSAMAMAPSDRGRLPEVATATNVFEPKDRLPKSNLLRTDF